MAESIIIIGAGVAGLAARCYAQMNGYRTKIFELHEIPGGLCAAWQRKGYVFDGCIHYLFGSGPGQPFHRVWEELGALKGRPIYHHEELMRVVAPDGRTLIAYSDPDRLGRICWSCPRWTGVRSRRCAKESASSLASTCPSCRKNRERPWARPTGLSWDGR